MPGPGNAGSECFLFTGTPIYHCGAVGKTEALAVVWRLSGLWFGELGLKP